MIFIMVMTIWMLYCDHYDLITWWNTKIKSECDEQDATAFNGIPSYHDAWDCPSKITREFHALIRINHDNILREVAEIVKPYNNDSNSLSFDIESPMKFGAKWNPHWIKFMGEYTGLSNNIPSLKQIAMMFPDVNNLYISIFYPGNTIIDNIELSRAFHRYNYGLSVPDNDIGLRIQGHDVKWKEKDGFIWDNTLSHSVWNHTLEPRILICADIPRELSGLNSLSSNIIYYNVKRTKDVNTAISYLRYPNVPVRL